MTSITLSPRENFAEHMLSFIQQQHSIHTLESDAGPLLDITELDPIIEHASRVSQQEKMESPRECARSLVEYLKYIQTLDYLNDKKLVFQSSASNAGMSCMAVKPRRGLPALLPKHGRLYLKDTSGRRYISDKKTITFDSFHQLMLQTQFCSARRNAHVSNAALASIQRATGNAIAGHGALEKDYESFKLPHNISLRTFGVLGQVMPDRTGIQIEAGKYEAVQGHTFMRVF